MKSRKFIITLVLILGATIGLYTGDVQFEQWFQFTQIVFGIYGLGNIGEHYTDAIKQKSENDKEKVKIKERAKLNSSVNLMKSNLSNFSVGDAVELSNGKIEKVQDINNSEINTENHSFLKNTGESLDSDVSIKEVYKAQN